MSILINFAKSILLVCKYYLQIFFFIIALLLFSCSIERKIAKQYIELNKPGSMLILYPDYVYKTSLKQFEIENADSLNEWKLDSTLFANSLYIQNISDSIILKKYIESLISGLKQYGFKIFTESKTDTFMLISPPSFIVNLSQIELEEYIMPVRDEEYFNDGELYYMEFDLNAVNINSWFEITELNKQNQESKILFTSAYTFDDVEGSFRQMPFTSEVKYKYTIDTLTVDDIYDFAEFLGKKYASYIYDYNMNEYIKKYLPENVLPNYYFHYNSQRQSLLPVLENKFIEMKP